MEGSFYPSGDKFEDNRGQTVDKSSYFVDEMWIIVKRVIIQGRIRAFDPTRCCLVLFDVVLCYLVLFRIIWCYLLLFDVV